MHSFLRVVEELAADGRKDPFLMSTVDTIAPPGTFVRFVEACENMPQSDVIFGLTTRIEEEKPLRVGIRSFPSGAGGEVVALGEEGIYASAGYYFVRPSVLGEAVACRAAHLTALRLFFRHLLDRGYRMAGVCMPESIDVDRPADIDAAEALLRTGPR
jgi:NDP-sugar pyrophosphorylase family protein